MPSIKVSEEEKYPRPYWPQELLKEGFVGEMLILDDAFTATVVHPQADLQHVKASLELVLRDVELRMKRQKRRSKRSISRG